MLKPLMMLVVMWMMLAGCGVSEPTVLVGERTGNVSIEHRGVVQDLTTGQVSRRVSKSWVQDLNTGEMKFMYGNRIEE